MEAKLYDTVIIGGGPGGCPAAPSPPPSSPSPLFV